MSDPRKSVVFAHASSDAYAFTGGAYRICDTILNLTGYWLRYNVSQTDEITGDSVLSDSIDVAEGWNLVGSISEPVATHGLLTEPQGIIISQCFGYDNGYFISDTIQPGKGYWIKMSQQGKLLFNAPAGLNAGASATANIGTVVNKALVESASQLIDQSGTLTLTDGLGRSQTLYINSSTADCPSENDTFSLPPLPPVGAYMPG